MRYPENPFGLTGNSLKTFTPAYVRIADQVRTEIEQKRWNVDDMLPSEPQMAKQYQVSTGTVKKAILQLVSEGFVYRVQGKGTYVAGSFVRSEKLRFYASKSDFTATDGETFAKFLSCEEIPPNAEVCRQLGIAETSALILLKRLMYSNAKPITVVHSFFELSRFKGLVNEQSSRFEKQALTLIIENDYATPTLRTQELFSVCQPNDPLIAELLAVPANAQMLLIEMLSLSYQDQPYEYRRSYCVPNKKIFRSY
ncbi:MAG: GntR family transcriptional regulator [Selenomonadaceae bacterium]|nr:GntR family transcriptional regulator [Selenomonadaceae bacterium]